MADGPMSDEANQAHITEINRMVSLVESKIARRIDSRKEIDPARYGRYWEQIDPGDAYRSRFTTA